MRKTVFVMFAVAFTVFLTALIIAGLQPTTCLGGVEVCDRHGFLVFLVGLLLSGVGVVGASTDWK